MSKSGQNLPFEPIVRTSAFSDKHNSHRLSISAALDAIVGSMLVVFARMSRPHSAVLGQVDGTATYRNIERFPEARTIPGIRVVRVDAAVSFVNANHVKKLLLEHAERAAECEPRTLVLDASGINDIDATGVEMLQELLDDLFDRQISLHLAVASQIIMHRLI